MSTTTLRFLWSNKKNGIQQKKCQIWSYVIQSKEMMDWWITDRTDPVYPHSFQSVCIIKGTGYT